MRLPKPHATAMRRFARNNEGFNTLRFVKKVIDIMCGKKHTMF